MLKRSIAAAFIACVALSAPAAAQRTSSQRSPAAPDLELWRLDCGAIENAPIGWFSDTFAYEGVQRTLTDSCYLIRNGRQYLLWDTGFAPPVPNQAEAMPGVKHGPPLLQQLRPQL